MTSIERGKLIAKLRKQAGLTQSALADLLHITDKAVSKWERGICLPDSSLLPQLSMLLDSDIEYIICGDNPYGEHKWVGELRVDDIEYEIGGKPAVFYLLSYFMLVGITDICIITENRKYINNLHLEQYGLNIKFSPISDKKVIVVCDKFLLFGSNLTRYFQTFMYNNKNIIPVLNGVDIPMFFTHNPSFSANWHKEHSERKNLGRGMICLPLNADADNFVKIYEKNCGCKIADLKEIAKLRGLV